MGSNIEDKQLEDCRSVAAKNELDTLQKTMFCWSCRYCYQGITYDTKPCWSNEGKLCCLWVNLESASCCDDGWIEFSGKTCCVVNDCSIPPDTPWLCMLWSFTMLQEYAGLGCGLGCGMMNRCLHKSDVKVCGLIICNRLPKQDYSLRVRVPKQTYFFSDERVFSLSPAICVGNSATRKGCSRTKQHVSFQIRVSSLRYSLRRWSGN